MGGPDGWPHWLSGSRLGGGTAREGRIKTMARDNLLHVNARREGEMALLCLEGELIAESRYEPERLMREWLEEGVAYLILQCASLTHIDSAGLSILLGASHRFRRHGGDLILAELNPSLNAIFEVTSMERYFKIFPSLEEAQSHFLQMAAERRRTADHPRKPQPSA